MTRGKSRRTPRWAGALLLATALATTACASNPFTRKAETPDEVAELKARVVELQRQVTVHEIEIARLRERLSELAAGRPVPPAAAPRATAPPRAPAPVAEPAPRPPVSFEQGDLPAEEPSPADEPLPADEPMSGAAAPAPSPRQPAAQGAPSPEAQALYDSGYSLVQQGRHDEAEERLQRFLAQYGNTELADNALYWIGESRYARTDYTGALEAFQQTAERYPQGNKLPDALLKVGLCLEKLGDLVGARDVLTEVARRFPGTAAAATAEESLRALS